VVGTYHVGEAAGRLGLRTMVTASSINALGMTWAERRMGPLALPIDESHPCRPQDAYSLSKWVDEQTIAALHRRTGLRTIAIRPPRVIWPERYPELLAIIDEHDAHYRLFWSYVDVRDLAVGFRLAVENESVEQEAFFITADDPFARQPLSELLPRYWPGTEELARGLTGTSPAVVSEKAKRLLGYQPQWSWRHYA
jgi:nucleoside-diphosphate-sugar epimerase